MHWSDFLADISEFVSIIVREDFMWCDDTTVLAGMKILIVDDIPENISALAIALESQGFDIETAAGGEQALQCVHDNSFDLILLDIKMDGMDGFQTCRALKAIDATRDIPVIFLTVSKETEDVVKGFTCGGVDYIAKPFRQEEVCARVRTHLYLRVLMKEKEKLIVELQEALAKVKTLSGLLPICSSCKKIRDDKGYWNQIETYIRERSEADFTHGICPKCAKMLYPGLLKDK
jgi:PleD family two-component response regulator